MMRLKTAGECMEGFKVEKLIFLKSGLMSTFSCDINASESASCKKLCPYIQEV
jgi:hypothetical protein